MTTSLLVASRKGLFHVGRTQAGWAVERVSFRADPVSLVLSDRRDQTLYAALALGHFGVKLHRSTNAGRTWEPCAVPLYPAEPKPEGVAAGGEPGDKPPKLDYIWSLEAGLADQPGRIWCGTVPGGLFVSNDRASTWERVESLWNHPTRSKWFGGGMDKPGVHSVCVDPRDGKHVTIGVSCAGVWVTRDDGQTWACQSQGLWAAYMPPEQKDVGEVQDPHRVVQCPASPDSLWLQHHNGIFRSVDGARTWTDIGAVTPSNFGFAVAVHPRDPETAWFVPGESDQQRLPVDARLVVTRTRDGGKTFTSLTHGLPQAQTYDIVFRHGLDVDDSGDVLAMGSTTGGLWVSEDGGDSWETIPARLPPIYCVRFV